MFERFNPQEEEQWYGDAVAPSDYHLDYLYFFVGKHNLASAQSYSALYLEQLNKQWGIEKKTSSQQIESYPNAWYFSDFSVQQYLALSQKINLAKWHLQNNSYQHQVFLHAPGRAIPTLFAEKYMIKKNWGFAGRGNRVISKNEVQTYLQSLNQEQVVEAYLERIVDFAITLIEEKMIIYKNEVMPSGQYKGTLIESSYVEDIEKFLSFYSVSQKRISEFLDHLGKLKSWLGSLSNQTPLQGSLDFFLYRQNEECAIHPGCEFNPRWTMGRVAYVIAKKYFPNARMVQTQFSKKLLPDWIELSPSESKVHFLLKAD